jgi:hypothetical protein
MPRSYPIATTTALNTGRIVDRGLITFELGSGLYGFWTGLGTFVFNGVTYVGAGSLISIDGVEQVTDLSSVPVTLRLSSIPNTDLTPTVLSTIEQEVYHQRPASISTAYFNADSYALLSVELEYRGYIDVISYSETVGGDATLEVRLESRFRDHQRTGYRVRSDVDQRRISASDNGLRHVTVVANEKVTFGRTPSKTGDAAKKTGYTMSGQKLG